ncbi:SLC26A/SulP transporter family protein [Phormidium sp. LEGE 05292]|uniref:SulP family inorganic anion transporter n=1 Tax=[Phormidium] sp. LEGE 05292 TaxID=767427 RepID=UPI0018823FF8|nr:SulP family inorganic anion transporter [Phormidium sp. LEGE 05292]MBE9226954.1 SLC26A/SulP transporter family protein [Phormidium sp. LEGE 05292]
MTNVHKQELHPSRLIPSLIAGVIIGVIQVTFSLSLAALIFSGNLSDYLPAGMAIALFSGCLMIIGMTLTSGFSGVIAGLQEAPATIIAMLVSEIASEMSPHSTSQEIYLMIISVIALSTLVTGLTCWGLGSLKLGNLSGFIPYPIIGAFLAGTGWLLLQGSIQVMTDIPLTISSLPSLFEAEVLPHWLSGLSLAVVLLISSRRYRHWSIIPTILFVAVLITYLLLWLTHTSINEAITWGWLLKTSSEISVWHPLIPSDLFKVNWLVIFNHLNSVLVIVFLSVLNLLLNLSSMEQTFQAELNIERELQTTGLMIFLSGLASGMIGYHSLSSSVLAHKLGARSRLVGLVAAAISGAVLISGSSILCFFPRPILGGLLLFLGLSFLVEWLYDAYFQLPYLDYCLLGLVWLIIVTVGFLEGIGVGLAIATILFAFRYGRIAMVREVYSGNLLKSYVARPLWQEQILQKKRAQIGIFQIQGFIFFGSSYHLLKEITAKIDRVKESPLRFVILECHLVSGLDASAIFSLTKLRQKLYNQKVNLVFCSLLPSIERVLKQGLCLKDESSQSYCRFFSELDLSLEWCEEQLLQDDKDKTNQSLGQSLVEQLSLWLSVQEITELLSYFDCQNFPSNYVLFHQGDVPQGLYFLISGQVSVLIQLHNGESKRLRTFSENIILGEISLYGQTPHSVSVVTDRPSKFYYLSSEMWLKIQQKKPYWAVALEHLIIMQLSEQLKHREQKWLNQLY